MRRILLFSVLYILVVTPLFASSDLQEADNHFTYQGKPIHPFLLEKFDNGLADYKPPMVVSVDVASAFDTNQFPNDEVKKNENGWLIAEHGEHGSDYESESYRWLGKMSNGVHVVEVSSSGGGSGDFMDLMFLKFSEGKIIWEEKPQKQLLMTITRTFSLGDRYEGEIKVFPDKIFIPASKNKANEQIINHDVELKMVQ